MFFRNRKTGLWNRPLFCLLGNVWRQWFQQSGKYLQPLKMLLGHRKKIFYRLTHSAIFIFNRKKKKPCIIFMLELESTFENTAAFWVFSCSVTLLILLQTLRTCKCNVIGLGCSIFLYPWECICNIADTAHSQLHCVCLYSFWFRYMHDFHNLDVANAGLVYTVYTVSIWDKTRRNYLSSPCPSFIILSG